MDQPLEPSVDWQVAGPAVLFTLPACLFALAFFSNGSPFMNELIGFRNRETLSIVGVFMGGGLSLLSTPALWFWTIRHWQVAGGTWLLLLVANVIAVVPLVGAALFLFNFGNLV